MKFTGEFSKKINTLKTPGIPLPDDQLEESKRIKRISYLLLSGVSMLLSVMNYLNSFYPMMFMTLLLCVGFLLCSLLNRSEKGSIFSEVFVCFMLMIVFSIFFVSGRNDGFAALWILLVPILSMLLLRLEIAFILSSYFQVLLIVFLYTGFRNYVAPYYTETFMDRFPVLYFANFLLASFLSVNSLYSQKIIQQKTYTDSLTGLNNRAFYDFVKDDYYEQIKNFAVLSLDVNGLKRINDQYGHIQGDILIQGAAECIKKAFSKNLLIARVGGDEFAVFLDADRVDVSDGINRLNRYTADWSLSRNFVLQISSGVAFKIEEGATSFESLYVLADNRMYERKEDFYKKSEKN